MMDTGKLTATLNGSLRALLALPILSATLLAGTPGVEELWSDIRMSENYIDYAVTIGDNGTLLYSDTGFTSINRRLYTSLRGTTSDTVWEFSDPSTLSLNRSVASSEKCDIIAVVRHQGSLTTNRHARREILNSSSSTPIFVHDFSELDSSFGGNWCHVSDDGRTVHAAYVKNGTTHLKRFVAPGSDWDYQLTGDWSFPTFDVAESFGLSEDMTRLYLGSNVYGKVWDLTSSTETLLFQQLFLGGAEAGGQAFSPTADLIAVPSEDRIDLYRPVGSSYGLSESLLPFGAGTDQKARLAAISEDGSTLAASYYLYPDNKICTLLAWDIASGQEILRVELEGSGQIINRPLDLDLSRDGRRLAASMSGAEMGVMPAVVVYSRDAAGPSNFGLLASFHRPGPASNLELSDDGSRLAVASQLQPFSFGFSEKVVEAINLGKDFDVRGSASLGSTATIDFYPENPHPTLGSALLLYATELEPTPLGFSIGDLYIKRQGIQLVGMGPVGPDGRVSKDIQITGPLGSTVYYQGFGIAVRQLSRSYVALTVIP